MTTKVSYRQLRRLKTPENGSDSAEKEEGNDAFNIGGIGTEQTVRKIGGCRDGGNEMIFYP